MLYILNAPVIPNYGVFRFVKIEVEEAASLLRQSPFVSAVGHLPTAELLSTLLGIEIPYNRIRVSMKKGDRAIVVRVLERLEEGKILTKDELQEMLEKGKIELGLLELLED